MAHFHQIISLLNSAERRKFYLLIIIAFIVSILDAIGIFSVMPFIGILINPESVIENSLFIHYAPNFLLGDEKKTKIYLGFIFFFLFLLSQLAKIINTYFQVKFSHMREYSISERVLDSYLSKSYSQIICKDNVEVVKGILTEVQIVIEHALWPLLNAITQVMLTIILISLVFIVNPIVAMVVFGTIFIFYSGVFLFFRSKARCVGEKWQLSNKNRFKILNEIVGAIKEIKLYGAERLFHDVYKLPSLENAKAKTNTLLLATLPKNVLEIFVFGFLMCVLIYALATESVDEYLPLVTLYALAGYRLLPAMTSIYSSLTNISISKPAFDFIQNEIISNLNRVAVDHEPVNIEFLEKLELKDVSYSYGSRNLQILNNVYLEVSKGKIIAIVGASGSGKTTLVDLAMGLLQADSGEIFIDNIAFKKSNNFILKGIGYVPQKFFMLNDTITKNVAFGISDNDIDLTRVKHVCGLVNLSEFIDTLPDGYETFIGENGGYLSGGQVQRLAIARALYKDPQCLVFDEATSALDYENAKHIMNIVKHLKKDLAVIIITHDTKFFDYYDKVYELKNGKLSISAEGC